MHDVPPIKLPRNSAIFGDTAHHALLSAVPSRRYRTCDPNPETDDIFGIGHRGPSSAPLTATRIGFPTSVNKDAATLPRLDDPHPRFRLGPYALDECDQVSDIDHSSNSSFNEDDELMIQVMISSGIDGQSSLASSHPSIGVSNFSALESYTGSSDTNSVAHTEAKEAVQYANASSLAGNERPVPHLNDVPVQARRPRGRSSPIESVLAMFSLPPGGRVSVGPPRERVDWAQLSTFERTWRELNAQLLVSLYGAKDVKLSVEDIDFVDGISSRLRAGASPSNGGDWTRGIFLGEPSE